MKTKGLFLIIALFICTMAYSQSKDTTVKVDKDFPKQYNKRTQVTNKDTVVLGRDTLSQNTLSAQLVYDISNLNRQDMSDVANGRVTYFDTVGTAIDTVSRHLPVPTDAIPASIWFTGWVWASDTIILSTTTAFTEGTCQLVFPNETYKIEILNPNYFNNLYIKRYFSGGHTGTAFIRVGAFWK